MIPIKLAVRNFMPYRDNVPPLYFDGIHTACICGDKFIIGQQTPLNLCSWAFYSPFPFAEVLQFGGSFPWENDRNKATVACPDPENPVVFELRRC